ncbi:MAG: FtsK/SpoIIIE domain-containing protein [Desulfobacteraceae bacterium]
MTVRLSVSQVREAIYQAAGDSAPDSPRLPAAAASLLGRIFHQSFSSLYSSHGPYSWKPAVRDAPPHKEEWRRVLESHIYKNLIGPSLGREQARLHEAAAGVLSLWEAAKNLNRWMVDLLWAKGNPLKTGPLPGLKLFPNEDLSLGLRMPGWSDSVRLVGVADLVLRVPAGPAWCLVELKLGRGCPEADLAQVCLYHLILTKARRRESQGSAALVAFRPEKQEVFFSAQELKEAQKRLVHLIGKLAGVLPGGKAESRSALQHLEPTRRPAPLEPPSHLGLGEQLVAIFKEYGRPVSIDGEPVKGPAFIRYPLKLEKGVKIQGVQKAAKEVQHRMRLSAAPLIHISDGRVVADIQRPDRETVDFSGLREVIESQASPLGCSSFIVGMRLDGTPLFADLSSTEHCHILAAGTTGSGKSEWLRSVLAGLVITNTPETLRLLLIDPKRTAFKEAAGSPFLLDEKALVFPDEEPASKALSKLVEEMNRRYRLFQDAGVDELGEYIAKTGRVEPRIVCACDEYADLISRGSSERREVESQVFRIGAKARAAGIHLLIATQQPSREVVKGALDANIPARAAFKMNKAIESSMLLGARGAENLLGEGDLLFKDIGDPVRLQAPLLAPQDRKSILGGSGRRPAPGA